MDGRLKLNNYINGQFAQTANWRCVVDRRSEIVRCRLPPNDFVEWQAVRPWDRSVMADMRKVRLRPLVFTGPVARTGKRPATQPNRTAKDRTCGCGCASFVSFRLPVALISNLLKTDERPVAIGCNRSFVYIFHGLPD